MKCLGLYLRADICQSPTKIHLFCPFVIESLYLIKLCLSTLLCDTLELKTIHGFDPYPVHALLAAVVLFSKFQNQQDFIKTFRTLIEDILSGSRGIP